MTMEEDDRRMEMEQARRQEQVQQDRITTIRARLEELDGDYVELQNEVAYGGAHPGVVKMLGAIKDILREAYFKP